MTDKCSLLRRRQIRSSQSCALATAELLKRVVGESRVTDGETLIKRVSQVGKKLTAAQPREVAVGNIVRRVLHVIRTELGEERNDEAGSFSEAGTDSVTTPIEGSHLRDAPSSMSRSQELPPRQSMFDSEDGLGPLPSEGHTRPSLMSSSTSYAATAGSSTPGAMSMFSLLSRPVSSTVSPNDSPRPGYSSPAGPSKLTQSTLATLEGDDLRSEIMEAIQEIIQELKDADKAVSEEAAEHIHSNEIVMTYGPSNTIQRFLLEAARKRKFTLFHVEGYPNNHLETHQAIVGKPAEDQPDQKTFTKTLAAAGVTVVVVPDSATFALMSRVNKVILDTHVVLANGGLVATAGAKAIAKAANYHKVPVVVVTPVFKLSPIYAFNFGELIEHGDPGAVLSYSEGHLLDKIEVENPLYDYVPPELVDLYITNLGGHAPSYLYRIVADHYSVEDNDLVDVE